MRPGNPNNNKRLRGRPRPNKGPNPLTRTYESNGPDVKVRGTALHVAEKYVQLARDAQSSGDTVMAENYFQHAEHYYRIIAAAQAQSPNPTAYGREDEGDDDYDAPMTRAEFGHQRPNGYGEPRQGEAPRYGDQRQNEPGQGEPRQGEPRQGDARQGEQRYVDQRPSSDQRPSNQRQGDQRHGEPRVYGDHRNYNGNGANGHPAPAAPPPGLGPQPILEPEFVPTPIEETQPAIVAETAAPVVEEAASAEDAAPRRRRSRGSRGRGRRTDAEAGGEEGGELPLGDPGSSSDS